MRELLWVAAIVTVAMLLSRGLGTPSIPDPPADSEFTAQVVAPSHTVPVIVKFGATWCGPCRAMEGELDRVASHMAGKVRIVRVDVDENRAWAEHFGVSGIPDTVVFHEGRGVGRRVGYLHAAEIEDWVGHWMQ
jgi:thioredoxin